MKNNKLKRVLISIALIVWIIMPDLIPGPIDDVIAFICLICENKNAISDGNS